MSDLPHSLTTLSSANRPDIGAKGSPAEARSAQEQAVDLKIKPSLQDFADDVVPKLWAMMESLASGWLLLYFCKATRICSWTRSIGLFLVQNGNQKRKASKYSYLIGMTSIWSGTSSSTEPLVPSLPRS